MTDATPNGAQHRLVARLHAPVDVASLAAFRILFGLMMCAGIVRFLAKGWVEPLFVEPTFFFKYAGFSWLEPLPGTGMYLLYALLAVLALCVALGWHYRIAIALFTAGFAYAELLDVTNYLNHYYLIVLLGVLLAFLPAERAWSLDARRDPSRAGGTVPTWMLRLLQFQVAVVYVHAGWAKFNPDWLLHAQPLNIWMTARVGTPVIGPMLDLWWVALAMSWAGFFFDTTIVGWLLWKRTRPFAFAVVLVFHFFTHVFFNIGMFPVIMPIAATLFFAPDWPRRFLARAQAAAGTFLPGLASRLGEAAAVQPSAAAAPEAPRTGRRRAAMLALVGAYCAFQALFPLRSFLYGGNVLWHEQGMRWSWKVKLREKNGAVTFHVRDPQSGRRWQVSPDEYLNPRQTRQMSRQPDLIVQLAHHIAALFEQRGFSSVEVRAEAWVSLNGRRPALMLDPEVDLARITPSVARADWILPAPTDPPARLGRGAPRLHAEAR